MTYLIQQGINNIQNGETRWFTIAQSDGEWDTVDIVQAMTEKYGTYAKFRSIEESDE